MKVNYTGGNGEFSAADRERANVKLGKLGRLIDRKSEQEAHVVLTGEKLAKKAEITLNYLQHSLVASGTGPAYLPALTAALAKLDKQVVKLRAKVMYAKRNGVKPSIAAANEAVQTPPVSSGPRLYPAKVSKKPMSVDEAVLVAIRKHVNYVAFRDAETGGISVVVQRPDGNFDFVRA